MSAMARKGRLAVASAGLALSLLGAMAEPACSADLALPVPRTTIYPGDVIVEDMLVERAFIAHTVARGTVHAARTALIGKVARRTLLALQPIAVNSIREPYLVNQGKPVLVVYETRGLTITGQATALENGSVGEDVSLRNTDSGLLIRGTVAPDGSVRLRVP